MINKYLITIIIPTKNRQEYVLKAVEQILSIDDERIQVVLQDNSINSSLELMLKEYSKDNRLKYNYSSEILSFVDNFDIAVSLADGDYVCIIGDDDGINPQIIDVVEWASKNNIDAIKPELNAVYFWPNSQAVKGEKDNGYLNIYKITAKAKMCNPYLEVEKLLKQGGQNYLSLDLVKLYHGIVKKECLDSIKTKTGMYFGGLSPDIYMTVALSLTINKVVSIDLPLTISGICSKSGSADSATGRHTGKLEDAPHFRGHEKYEWADLVPRFYSVETIWADSAIAAIYDLNKSEILEEFNVGALAESCLKKYPEYKKIVEEHYDTWLKKTKHSKIKLKIINLNNSVSYFTKKALRRIKRRPGDVIRINGVTNIVEAGDVLKQRFDELEIDVKSIKSSLDNLIK